MIGAAVVVLAVMQILAFIRICYVLGRLIQRHRAMRYHWIEHCETLDKMEKLLHQVEHHADVTREYVDALKRETLGKFKEIRTHADAAQEHFSGPARRALAEAGCTRENTNAAVIYVYRLMCERNIIDPKAWMPGAVMDYAKKQGWLK